MKIVLCKYKVLADRLSLVGSLFSISTSCSKSAQIATSSRKLMPVSHSNQQFCFGLESQMICLYLNGNISTNMFYSNDE